MRPRPASPAVKHGHLEHTGLVAIIIVSDFEETKEAVLLTNLSFIHQISVALFTMFQKLGTRQQSQTKPPLVAPPSK